MTNHCVNIEVAKVLGKDLYTLNCNLHPLGCIAVGARTALAALDREEKITSKVYGYEGRTANLTKVMATLRHKYKSGDPSGFKAHLTQDTTEYHSPIYGEQDPHPLPFSWDNCFD